MPRKTPHPQTILHLIPGTERAQEVLYHPDNARFVSLGTLRNKDSSIEKQKFGLEIGYHVSERPRPEVLVELGRNADLVLSAACMSAIHFSFEVHTESKAIMLYDRSRFRTTTITPNGFRTDGNFRKVVLCPGSAYKIQAGGERKSMYSFDIWWAKTESVLEDTERDYQLAANRIPNPRLARTVDDAPTELASWYQSRLHTPSAGGVQRTKGVNRIGRGSYGKVIKAIDLDSGRLIAVKNIQLPPAVNGTRSAKEERLYREVKILSSICHKNIVEYLGSSRTTGSLSIYMGLSAGNLTGLLGKDPGVRHRAHDLLSLLKQMLEALDYLAYRGLCHRDVKPDNILYTMEENVLHFQLADFGLANEQIMAETQVGTQLFVAPEIWFADPPQTPKVDIWSLFVTFVSIMRCAGFEENKLKSYQQVLDVVRVAAASELCNLSPMARENSRLRASAAQLLKAWFGGEGLTTPRHQITAVPDPNNYQDPS